MGASLTSPAYKVEITFVASAAAREAIDADPQKSPNLSPAVKAGNLLFVSGLLAEGDAAAGDPGAQTRDIIRKLDALLTKGGFARPDVRDLLIYVTDDEAAKAALAECHTAFGSKPAMTPVKVGLCGRGRAGRDHDPGGTRMTPLRIGISSCLLGDEVRFDGGHKRDTFLTETLAPFVEWVRVCPEVEIGMGVPREPVRLVRDQRRHPDDRHPERRRSHRRDADLR